MISRQWFFHERKITLFFKLIVFYSLKKLESNTLDLKTGEGILAIVSSDERMFIVKIFLKDQMQSWCFAMFAVIWSMWTPNISAIEDTGWKT